MEVPKNMIDAHVNRHFEPVATKKVPPSPSKKNKQSPNITAYFTPNKKQK
jgi:hypothetical protein